MRGSFLTDAICIQIHLPSVAASIAARCNTSQPDLENDAGCSSVRQCCHSYNLHTAVRPLLLLICIIPNVQIASQHTTYQNTNKTVLSGHSCFLCPSKVFLGWHIQLCMTIEHNTTYLLNFKDSKVVIKIFIVQWFSDRTSMYQTMTFIPSRCNFLPTS